MKKIIIFFLGITLGMCTLQAQDLIVTVSGDSINCTITKVKDGYIYFTFKQDSEVKSTLMPVKQAVTRQKNYFSESEIPYDYVFKAKFPRFRLAVDGGWQYRFAKLAEGMDPSLKNHYTKLKSGFNYDIQAGYFFTENQGFEAMFSQYFFHNNLGSIFLIDEEGNAYFTGSISEKIRFNYAGINYIVRFYGSKKKNCFLMAFGIGYLGYIDKLFFDEREEAKITARTLGVNFGIGYDIALSKYFSIGFKCSFFGGYFKNYDLTIDGITTPETMPKNSSEGLGTIKLSLGLRFNR
jgi:hypothetical protein